MRIFPLDYTNDWASYIAQLFFLAKCGFHQYCPYWYNGFENFLIAPPGWYFFALPFYWITNSFQMAAYISIIAIFILSYIFLYLLCKKENLSITHSIAFFFLFFGNAMAIGDFIRLGRTVSLFPFMLLIPFITLLHYYVSHKIDKYFLLLIPLYSLILISHYQEALLFSTFILGLFLVKKNIKERAYILISFICSLILSSFWLYPFISNVMQKSIIKYNLGEALISSWKTEPLTGLMSIIIPLLLGLTFYNYYKKNKNSAELAFFLPLLFLALIFVLRLHPRMPFLENIHPDPFIMLFLFFTIFFFLKIDLSYYSSILRKAIIITIYTVSVASIIVSLVHTPWFIGHSQLEQDMLEIFKNVNGTYMIYTSNNIPPTSYSKAYYSYMPLFLNLSTASGWYPQITTPEYERLLSDAFLPKNKDYCPGFIKALQKVNVSYVIGQKENCDYLADCKLYKIQEINGVCSYKIP